MHYQIPWAVLTSEQLKENSPVAQRCPAPCDPVDCSSPDYSAHGILQAIILEWVAIPSSGDLPGPGIKPASPALQVDSLPSEPPVQPCPNK